VSSVAEPAQAGSATLTRSERISLPRRQVQELQLNLAFFEVLEEFSYELYDASPVTDHKLMTPADAHDSSPERLLLAYVWQR
jgi:hypothetical protein